MTIAFALSAPSLMKSRPCTLHASSCSFAGKALPRRARAAAHIKWAMKVGIFFSTVTGNTDEVAGIVKECFGDVADDPKEIAEVNATEMSSFEALVVGAPTWNTGADDERSGTSWDEFLYEQLAEANLARKPVAVFGLGDGNDYADNFCDAIEEMHDCFQKTGAKMIGYSDPGEVEFEESKSVRDGKFLGLAIDHVNASDTTEERVKAWCAQVVEEAGLTVSV